MSNRISRKHLDDEVQRLAVALETTLKLSSYRPGSHRLYQVMDKRGQPLMSSWLKFREMYYALVFANEVMIFQWKQTTEKDSRLEELKSRLEGDIERIREEIPKIGDDWANDYPGEIYQSKAHAVKVARFAANEELVELCRMYARLFSTEKDKLSILEFHYRELPLY